MHYNFFIILFLSLYLHSFSSNNIFFNNTSIEKKIGQMLMIGIDGTKIEDIQYLKKDISQGKIGGILLLGYNIENEKQLKKFISDIQSINKDFPLFIAIDQEGGYVQRLNSKKGFNDYPSHYKAASLSENEVKNIYDDMAAQLKNLGVNVNFGPVVDVNINPESPVIGKIERSFSSSPEKVIKYSEIFIKSHKQKNILTVLKHFPGHGSSMTDSHQGFTDITNTWDEIELLPYKYFIQNKISDGIMTGHLFHSQFDVNYPASMSTYFVNDLLIKSLNYNGLIFTDDLEMNAISNFYNFEEVLTRTINSGNDIILFSGFNKKDNINTDKIINTILKLIENEKIKKETIDISFFKIISIKNKYNF